MKDNKEVIYMILLMILALIVILMTVVTIAVISVGGAVGLILFSDVIVCILVLLWIIKKIIKR